MITMKMIKKLVVWVIFLGVVINSNAQDVQFTANAPKVVEVGEQFQVQFSVNAKASNFIAPELKDFNLLMGPSTSQQSYVSYDGSGKVSQVFTLSYVYVFEAVKPGKFMVGPAEVTVGGKKYKSNSFTIEVIKGAGGGSSGTQQQQQQSSSGSNEQVTGNDEVFIRLLLDKRSVYQGEYLTASVKLYTKLGISSVGRISPSLSGFFTQEVDIPQPSLVKENVNGQIYHTAILKKVILIPQRSGSLKIDGISMDCIVQRTVKSRSRGFFDDFFGPDVQEQKVTLKTLPVSINVKPLPANKPESFNGAVGKFSFNATIDKNSVKTNDAITLKLTVNGSGNLKLIESPKVGFPTDFDTYDPKISQATAAQSGDINGSKTFEYLIIPRNAGSYKIPAINFSYFDPSAGLYKTISSHDMDIEVAKGDNVQSATVVTGLSKEDVKFIGKDILFIKTSNFDFVRVGEYFFGSVLFYLILAISLLAFAGIIIWRRSVIKQNSNVALMRNRKADKFATKRLKQSKVHMLANEKEKFYDELLKAIWGYLSDKLNIPQSDLSRDTAIDMLNQRNVDEATVKQFIELVDNCEFARYAPGATSDSINHDYQKTIELITKLQQKLK
ncbi:MAG TPA: BatD family protein [Bacteroidales bacterium]|nr:BatD family protein [Bacteroidales bacterium]